LTVPSSSVGVYVADFGHRCCLCSEVIIPGTFVKQIGSGYATMPCVDKALSWMVESRERCASPLAERTHLEVRDER
jgi:hypothetical protein